MKHLNIPLAGLNSPKIAAISGVILRLLKGNCSNRNFSTLNLNMVSVKKKHTYWHTLEMLTRTTTNIFKTNFGVLDASLEHGIFSFPHSYTKAAPPVQFQATIWPCLESSWALLNIPTKFKQTKKNKSHKQLTLFAEFSCSIKTDIHQKIQQPADWSCL